MKRNIGLWATAALLFCSCANDVSDSVTQPIDESQYTTFMAHDIYGITTTTLGRLTGSKTTAYGSTSLKTIAWEASATTLQQVQWYSKLSSISLQATIMPPMACTIWVTPHALMAVTLPSIPHSGKAIPTTTTTFATWAIAPLAQPIAMQPRQASTM